MMRVIHVGLMQKKDEKKVFVYERRREIQEWNVTPESWRRRIVGTGSWPFGFLC